MQCVSMCSLHMHFMCLACLYAVCIMCSLQVNNHVSTNVICIDISRTHDMQVYGAKMTQVLRESVRSMYTKRQKTAVYC